MAEHASLLTAMMSDPASDEAFQRSPLLEAPAEIRLKIYQALFKGAEMRLVPSSSMPQIHGYSGQKITSILRVCRLLRKESQDAYFSWVTFFCPVSGIRRLVALHKSASTRGPIVLSTDLHRIENFVITPQQHFFSRGIEVVESVVRELWSLQRLTWETGASIVTGAFDAPSLAQLRESRRLRDEQFGHLLLRRSPMNTWSKAIIGLGIQLESTSHKLWSMHFQVGYINTGQGATYQRPILVCDDHSATCNAVH
jgi:hypothetical protein